MFSYNNGLEHQPFRRQRGTSFASPPTVEDVLPRATMREEERPDEVAAMLATNRPYRILITDDDTGCRESLREIVEEEGYGTYLAASGEEALDIVREEPVHL